MLRTTLRVLTLFVSLSSMLWFAPVHSQDKSDTEGVEDESASTDSSADEAINLDAQSYEFGGESFQLSSGVHEGDSGKTTVVASTVGDINNDSRDDLVVVFKLETKESNELYFFNALLADEGGNWLYAGEEFLGDLIAFKFLDIYRSDSLSKLTGAPIDPALYGKFVVGLYVLEPGQTEEEGIFQTRHWQITDETLVVVDGY